MIRLKPKQQEKNESQDSNGDAIMEDIKASNSPSNERTGVEESKGQVKILGIGRGKKGAKPKAKRRTPGEIRIQKDIAELDGGDIAKVTFPNPNNLTSFNVQVKAGTGFWKGASYDFEFKIPDLYPHEAPKVRCTTPIYHPNIDFDGNVCLNILREDWKPVLDINGVIYGLIYLFYEPNPDDPLNREAADLYRSDIKQFERIVARSLKGGTINGRLFPRLI